MKTSFILIFICVPFSYLFGEIKNGYQVELEQTQASINRLNSKLLENNRLTSLQRLRIKSEIRNLSNFLVYYQLTQALISQLESVSPDLFNEMSNLKDKKERITDIFIKLIPRDQARTSLKAVTRFRCAPDDVDAHLSEYGKYSVSIIVWIVHNSLQLLYHELGHVKYIVPNLATYSEFFKKRYDSVHDLNSLGHNRHDQSGKLALEFEKRFFRDRASYVSNHNEKLASACSMIQGIAKNNRTAEAVLPAESTNSPAPTKLIVKSSFNFTIVDPIMIKTSFTFGWNGLKKIPHFQ